jgi:hypothetical protein
MIKEFNKTTLNQLRKSINVALSLVEEEHGIELHAGNISYAPNTCTVKVECKTLDEDGKPFDQFAADFAEYCGLFGFEAEDFGKTFQRNGKTFTISGLKTNNRKYPVLATWDGKTYKLRADDVLLAIGKKKQIDQLLGR